MCIQSSNKVSLGFEVFGGIVDRLNTLKSASYAEPLAPHLDKLAQLDTTTIATSRKDTIKDITQNIAGFKSREQLRQWASSKWLTNQVVGKLLYLDSKLHNRYLNTFKCGSTIQVESGTPKIYHCKNRFCVQCARNRTGTLINQYDPIIKQWQEKQFVTLTIPNVSALELEQSLKAMSKTIALIQRTHRKKYGFGFKAIRKLEITYNFRLKNYHPHFHLIVEGKSESEYIVSKWLEHWKNATIEAQDIRQATEGSEKELFKYFAKIWKYDRENKKVECYPANVMDVIYRAMDGKRVIQPTGFTKKEYYSDTDKLAEHLDNVSERLFEELKRVSELLEIHENKTPINDGLFIYNRSVGDWVCKQTGLLLSGYQKPKDLKTWFIQNMDEADSYHLQGFTNTKAELLNLRGQTQKELTKFKQRKRIEIWTKKFPKHIKNELIT